MNEQEQRDYLENYKHAKEEGELFFPDALFRDALVSLLIFLILVALAYFLGAPLEARANPGDTNYTPRPEWYFLFLFQMLKYFPGKLEVIGVVLLPTLGVVFLFLLPFLDRGPKRHFLARPLVTGFTAFVVVGIVFLTVQASRETPPPAEVAAGGDQTAALYAANCAPCHGPTITVPAGANLHAIIAQGKHEGMPAWSADLTADQIDALAGFILSPGGSTLFTQNCAACHDVPQLVAGSPENLRNALEQGRTFASHAGLEIPDWATVMTAEERTRLLNFLEAPDGQRLFTINCSACHGEAVAFAGSESDLRAIISKGGRHLEMPSWRGTLNETQLDALAQFVVSPTVAPGGAKLFRQYCSSCHADRIPPATDVAIAREAIASGGAHQTMPVWGTVLTSEQLDALISYTFSAAQGAPLEVGRQLFAQNCSPCHGKFGEGGPNPTRANDIIAPISSGEFLKTRDDFTLRSIISQGQPNFGMSPFGTQAGGPLDGDAVDAIVAYIRSWEANPPVELPSEVAPGQAALTGEKIFADVCARCHGSLGEGGLGPALATPAIQQKYDDQELFDAISNGREASPMLAWGEILTTDQIQQLVKYIRTLKPGGPSATATPGGPATFAADVLPFFQEKCAQCHSATVELGGWDASSYQKVMSTGDHAPVIVAGDSDASLLAQKLLGTQMAGNSMPPGGTLPQDEIQRILDWIAAGAEEN